MASEEYKGKQKIPTMPVPSDGPILSTVNVHEDRTGMGDPAITDLNNDNEEALYGRWAGGDGGMEAFRQNLRSRLIHNRANSYTYHNPDGTAARAGGSIGNDGTITLRMGGQPYVPGSGGGGARGGGRGGSQLGGTGGYFAGTDWGNLSNNNSNSADAGDEDQSAAVYEYNPDTGEMDLVSPAGGVGGGGFSSRGTPQGRFSAGAGAGFGSRGGVYPGSQGWGSMGWGSGGSMGGGILGSVATVPEPFVMPGKTKSSG